MKKYFWNCWLIIGLLAVSCDAPAPEGEGAVEETINTSATRLGESQVVTLADAYLREEPVTITAFKAERSAGGIHDYFSEGAYWWPNPEDPDGPYIRKDGQRNPGNFDAHKNALRQFSDAVTTLTAAYEITGDEKYARHAIRHLVAWFSTPETRMNPSLLYGQAIKGITTGRGIGIIDTLRLIDVALSIRLLADAKLLASNDHIAIKQWFSDFGDWLTTHPYGQDERDNNNNHSTWWGAQVAAFARVAERQDLLDISIEQFKKQLDLQMAEDGSFPDEIHRTKPFHYTNYTLRAWTTYCQLASTPTENLWKYNSKNGQLQKAVDFAVPYLREPETWPYRTELEPETHPHQNDFLYFTGRSLKEKSYLELWETLPPKEDENHANLVLWEQTGYYENGWSLIE